MHGNGERLARNPRGGTATWILTLVAVIGLLSSMGGAGGARAQGDQIEVAAREESGNRTSKEIFVDVVDQWPND